MRCRFCGIVFGVLVSLETQGKPPFGSDKVSGAVDDLEPEGAYGLEWPSVGIFQGAIAFCESGFDLEVDQEVVRENDELLPGTIGVVIVCGDGIEAETGLEFADGLPVHSGRTPTAEFLNPACTFDFLQAALAGILGLMLSW